MPRLAAALVLLVLLVPVPVAAGQGDPFGPLPPAQPGPTPEPTPVPGADDGDIGRTTLVVIGLGVLAAFFGIGWWITRDARHHLTEDDRAIVEGTKHPDHVRDRRAKEKARARAKAKAQRRARRKRRR